jgi:hypothetical protein
MAASAALPVKVRMYRQGLGDCFLVSFGKKGSQRHVMIDCGTLGATTTQVKMKDVVKHVSDSTGKHLDLLVATHEHKDHVSGFNSEKPTFDEVKVDHVWLAWTENAEDDDAKKIAKYKGDLIGAAKQAARALETDAFGAGAAHARAKELGGGIRELLGFSDESALGATLAKTINEAMGYVHEEGAPSSPSASPAGGRADLAARRAHLRAGAAARPQGARQPRQARLRGALRAAPRGAARSWWRRRASSPPPIRTEAYYADRRREERAELERVRPFDSRHRIDAKGDAGKAAFKAYFGAEEGWRAHRPRLAHRRRRPGAAARRADQQHQPGAGFELIEKGRVGKVLLFPPTPRSATGCRGTARR